MTGMKISVVMTVYDNARELEANLPVYLSQDYAPGYEVIVVDKSSTDDTDDVLTRLKCPQLYTTFLPRPNLMVSRQRMALTIGVKAAKGEWVVFADINTPPPSAQWLAELDEYTTTQTAAMLGYIKTNGDVKLQLFSEVNRTRAIVGKTERRQANGHKGSRLRYLRGKYDFVAVRSKQAHDLLRYFELDIRGWHLFSQRLRVACYNLTH
jgi:glycosyltransferase involved in cell wall biosynthesis